MTYDPRKHHRRSIRLKDYDYTQPGAYLVTLVAYNRECVFGEIVNGEMQLNQVGKIADQEWRSQAQHFPNLRLDAFVIMPNHIHAILVITDSENCGNKATHPDDLIERSPHQSRPHGPARGSLGAYIGQFKSRLTKRLGLMGNVWQRNYYEHIIRNEVEHARILAYIQTNPQRWADDQLHIG